MTRFDPPDRGEGPVSGLGIHVNLERFSFFHFSRRIPLEGLTVKVYFYLTFCKITVLNYKP